MSLGVASIKSAEMQLNVYRDSTAATDKSQQRRLELSIVHST